MSETLLIFLLYILVVARVIIFKWPSVLPESVVTPDSSGNASSVNWVTELIDSIVYAGVAALFLIHFIVRSFWIPSGSMEHTLEIGDYILVNEVQYRISRPMRGDIAVFHPPAATYTGDKTDLIKRVVGIEGDVLEVKDGALWRNGEKLDESAFLYNNEPIDDIYPRPGATSVNAKGEIQEMHHGGHVVPKGCCFMMGDHRNNSADSRVFGDVPLENYVGRAEVIFWPLNRARILH